MSMVKIKPTRKYFSCNSRGKMESETFPVWDIKVGVEGSRKTISVAFCGECLQKLQTETNMV